MYRSGVRRNKRQLEARRGWLLLGLAAVVLIVGVVVAIYSMQPPLGPDGCPDSNDAPPAHTVILIDQTDALSDEELDYARLLIRNEYFWLPPQGRLTILSIAASPGKARPPISLCRMWDPTEVSVLTSTPEKVQRDFDKKAGSQLEAFFAGMQTAPTQKLSPIIETLGRQLRDPRFGSDIPKRRLVILSDMAQFSDRENQYKVRKRGSFESADAVAERYGLDFSGVTVNVHYVERSELGWMQGDRHQQWWHDFLTDSKSAQVTLGHDLQRVVPPGKKIYYPKEKKPAAKPTPSVKPAGG